VGRPPPRSRRGIRFLTPDVVEQLRANPKRWARVKAWPSKSSAASAAKRVRTGEISGVDPAEWEVEARTTDGGSALWLRFVGSA
jgi:hypothetical protein